MQSTLPAPGRDGLPNLPNVSFVFHDFSCFPVFLLVCFPAFLLSYCSASLCFCFGLSLLLCLLVFALLCLYFCLFFVAWCCILCLLSPAPFVVNFLPTSPPSSNVAPARRWLRWKRRRQPGCTLGRYVLFSNGLHFQ